MIHMLRFRSVVVFTVLTSCGAAGATICVNPQATSGCVNAISAAVLLANANDTIQVAPGTYKEMVTSITPASPTSPFPDSPSRTPTSKEFWPPIPPHC
jgi:hypothetical protein